MTRLRHPPVFVLLFALSVTGFPRLAVAAGGDAPPLMYKGHLLSEVLFGNAGSALPMALRQQDGGRINGVVHDRRGRPLASYTLRLMRVLMAEGQPATQMIGTTTTGEDGRYSFSGLPDGNYLVEALRGSEIVASGRVEVAAGGVREVNVQAAGPDWWQRRSTGAKLGIIAASVAAPLCWWYFYTVTSN